MTLRYPNDGYDSIDNLYSPNNDSITELASEWVPGSNEIVVNDASSFSASGGFCTVYVKYHSIDVEKRVTTFQYSGVSENTLTGVVALNNVSLPRPIGSQVVENIMADHRMALVDATLALQKEIGHIGTDDEDSIEFFTHKLVTTVKKPRPFFTVSNGNRGFIHDEFHFVDKTYRLQDWQDIEWKWDFGDGTYSDEQNPTHIYQRPGRYTVRLTVRNNYGVGKITARDLITVLGKSPSGCDIVTSTTIAIANEDTVQITARPSPPDDVRNHVVRYNWDVGDNKKYPNNPNIYTVFDSGGVYPIGLTILTAFGNYAKYESRNINVVERNSVWMMVQKLYSNSMSIEEFSPVSGTWKSGHGPLTATRNWEDVDISNPSRENFLFSGGLHEFLKTFQALLIFNEDKSTMKSYEVDCLTDSYSELPSRTRGWGWCSCRINWFESEASSNEQVYVFFGHLDPSDPKGQSIPTLEHFGMKTKTWEIMSIDRVAAGVSDEEIIRQSAAPASSSNLTKRSRVSNWKDSIYILSSDGYDYFSSFVSFNPIVKTWSDLGSPTINNTPYDIRESTMMSMNNGLYIVSANSDMGLYDPITKTWSRLVGNPAWATTGSSSVTDTNALMKSASSSAVPHSGDSVGYATTFYGDSFGKFDEVTKISTSLPVRTDGAVSAMGVF